jgi:hypothetical protein
MLKFKDNKFISIKRSSLKDEEILERYNLQQAIIDSWDQFKSEIGMPDILYVGQEVNPHNSVENRIDILAFHPNENLPIVIELKRGKNKLQLLQSITYASMVSSWGEEEFLKIAEENNSFDLEDLKSSLSGFDSDAVRIVLLAEKYDPEVIISADWLYRAHELDIIACSINVFENEKEVFFSFTQKYPLAELEDSYVERTRKKLKIRSGTNGDQDWEDVKQKIAYSSWGSEVIDLCRQRMDGDPSRRRFVHVFKNYDGLKGISINIRQKYVNVYIFGKPEEGDKFFQNKFRDEIEISEWKNGWSFNVKTERHYEDLLKWLPLKKFAKVA